MEIVEFLLFVVKPILVLVQCIQWVYNTYTKELPEVLTFDE